MTDREKFAKGIVVYKNESDDYVLELWAASTKHPDSIFHMKYDKQFKLNDCMDEKYQVFQWLLLCASELTWSFHAKELVEYALENWYFN